VYESLLTEEAPVAAESLIGICCGTDLEQQICLLLKSLYCLLQCDDQSATGGLVPLSATIDTISINFLNKKTSFAYYC